MSGSDRAGTQALAENHLAFMAAQRGTLRRTGDFVALDGTADFLSWWSPLAPADEVSVPEGTARVRLFPWSDTSWQDRLRKLGFTAVEQLSYMAAPVAPGGADELPDGVGVTVVASDEDAVAFADTQAAGFLEPGEAGGDWWRAFFREVALRNHGEPDQRFYLLRCEGEPAAVSLTVTTGGVCGIYAVATRPPFRHRGFAGLLLGRIRRDAHERGDSALGLQVEVGSAAERLYLKAGFTSRFVSTIHER